MKTYTDAELDRFEEIFEIAAEELDTDLYFDVVLGLDPDQSIEKAISERRDKAESVRRASLSDEDRTTEDAHSERLLKIGMAIVRRKIAERRELRRF